MSTFARPCRVLCVALSLVTAFPFAGLAQQGPWPSANSGGKAPLTGLAVLELDATGSTGTEWLREELQERGRFVRSGRPLDELLNEVAAAEGDCFPRACASGMGKASVEPRVFLSGPTRWDEPLRLSRASLLDVHDDRLRADPGLPVDRFSRALDIGVITVADESGTPKPKQPARPPAKPTAPAPAKPKAAAAKPSPSKPEKQGVAWYWWALGAVAAVVVVAAVTQKSGGGGGGGGGSSNSSATSCSNCGSVGFAW